MRIRKRSVLLSPPLPAALKLADRSPSKIPQQLLQAEEEKKEAGGVVADGGKEAAVLHPHCSRYSPHQQPIEEDRPPSDLQLVITRGKNGWICSDGDGNKGYCMLPNSTHVEALKGGGGEEDASAGDGNSKSHEKSSSAGIATGFQLPSSSSHPVGRWCEGEKTFPLKKRRGSYEWGRGGEEETIIIEKEKKMKTKLKKTTTPTKRNEEVEEEQGDGVSTGGIVKKRGSSASTPMEGSRCSRVNGRGWRCCQQTLVGYSLCEHHLGKGRLRSMSSVRISSKPKKNEEEDDDGLLSSMLKLQQKKQLQADENEVGDDDDDEEEEEEEEEKRPKKKKIGTVKARSISSLLGQTDHTRVTLPLSDNIEGTA